jgi:hypothetical protein
MAGIPFLIYFVGYNTKTMSLVLIFEAIFTLILCIFTFNKLAHQDSQNQIRNAPMFWIILAFFVNSVFGMVFHSLGETLLQYSVSTARMVYSVFLPFIQLAPNLLFAYSFLKKENI